MASLEAQIIHSQNLLAKARSLGCDRLAVMVSSGRDSACLAHMAHRSGIPSVYIHNYLVPDLEIVEAPLQDLEQKLDIKIIRLASQQRRQMLDRDVLCINKIWDAEVGLTARSKKYYDMIANIAKTPWMATGIARADSPRRRLALTQSPNPNPRSKRVYPMDLWRAVDVKEFVEKNNIKLSLSYRIQGRSFELMSVNRVYPLKSMLPNDYRKICNDFPLMDALCWLYERRARKYGAANLPKC